VSLPTLFDQPSIQVVEHMGQHVPVIELLDDVLAPLPEGVTRIGASIRHSWPPPWPDLPR
jgi:hypothetical protein